MLHEIADESWKRCGNGDQNPEQRGEGHSSHGNCLKRESDGSVVQMISAAKRKAAIESVLTLISRTSMVRAMC